jgi:putative FmdB family regulatory protein
VGANLIPTYPFACEEHGSTDIMLRMDDRDSPQRCAECGNIMTRKMATGMAFTVWGGRWRDQWRDGPDGYDDGLGPQAE